MVAQWLVLVGPARENARPELLRRGLQSVLDDLVNPFFEPLSLDQLDRRIIAANRPKAETRRTFGVTTTFRPRDAQPNSSVEFALLVGHFARVGTGEENRHSGVRTPFAEQVGRDWVQVTILSGKSRASLENLPRALATAIDVMISMGTEWAVGGDSESWRRRESYESVVDLPWPIAMGDAPREPGLLEHVAPRTGTKFWCAPRILAPAASH